MTPFGMTIQRPRGTRDFLSEDSFRRGVVKKTMQDLLQRWSYQEISTPTFENLELFTIKSGQSIIDEIYAFEDKGGRNLALRPELTAPVMRMYVNELQNAPKPLRLHYFGNCFRYERPQKGRFREFWQLGVELIGSNKPDAEAEVIALAQALLKSVNVPGDLHVGYLGVIRQMMGLIPKDERPAIMKFIDKKERDLLRERLEDIGADHLGITELIQLKGRGALKKAIELSEDLAQMEKESEKSAAGKGERNLAHSDEASHKVAEQKGRAARADRAATTESDLAHFEELVELLDCYGVEATIDFEIVRGLDYYTGTVFEIYTTGLGAQNQVCGGGTYELAGLLGGREARSTGFGLGFDRIMEVAQVETKPPAPVVIVFMPEVRDVAIKAAKELRRKMQVQLDVMNRGLGAQLKHASTIGADYVVIIGPKEVEMGKFTLRNMESGEQKSLTPKEIEEALCQDRI